MSHDAAPPKPGEGPPPLSGRKASGPDRGAHRRGGGDRRILGIVPRVRARTTLQQQTDALAAPDVLVAPPKLGKVGQEVVLPGNVQAFTDAPIFARTSGYLKSWSFDIGAHVKKGQRLAVIASPEVDQQLQQAQADVAHRARPTRKYAETQSTRYQDLLNENAVSKQDTDNFRAQANSTSNQVASAQANVRRLAQLTGFQNVFAPFDGVITARNVDIGTLDRRGRPAASCSTWPRTTSCASTSNVPQVYSRDDGAGRDRRASPFPSTQGRSSRGRSSAPRRPSIRPSARCWWRSRSTTTISKLFPGAYAAGALQARQRGARRWCCRSLR